MSCGGEGKQWTCGKPGAVNLQKVSSIVRDIGEPCLSQSPIKVAIAIRLPHLLFLFILSMLHRYSSKVVLNNIEYLLLDYY